MELPTSETYTYHYNGIGSTIAMTDQSQTIINTYNYEPFGKLANESEAITQPFKYVGQLGLMTEDNDLIYIRARYYDSGTGRFISEDPSGLSAGVNLYSYAINNPINYYDSNGRLAIGAIAGALGGAYSGAMSALANGGNFWAGAAGGVAGAGAGFVVGAVLDDFNGTLAGAAAGGAIGGAVGGLVGNATVNAIKGNNLLDNAAYSAISGAAIGGAGAASSYAAIATGATAGQAAVGSQILLFPYEVGANAIYNQYSSGSSTSITSSISSSGGGGGK